MIGEDFPPNDFELFGLNLTDPTDFIYDILMAIMSFYFGYKLKGIGAKTAGRIILELKDKIKLDGEITSPGVGNQLAKSSMKQEALTALSNLGLPKAQMSKRIDKIVQEAGGASRNGQGKAN